MTSSESRGSRREPRDALARFHPTIRAWFGERLGDPAAPQRRGWPAIAAGEHVLIAAPTGSGKTLAAFLHAIDELLSSGSAPPSETALPDACSVLYISPLKALGNDVQKNLARPLEELRARDESLPEVRVTVRSGDTTGSQRQAMVRRPPHILVTTPESFFILLTSDGGRGILRTVRTVIVDEIHALLGDKRGAHLALSLERLVALAGDFQRVGLSATQKPIGDVARFLVGPERPCTTVDIGHAREMDIALEVPASPLEAVCSHEVWGEIYDRIVEHIEAHRTTLIFTGTRKLAERVSARLQDRLGEAAVTCHHSSLSKERRLDAERRLKEGELRALVATASLELGIDIGDVDLVVQVGVPRSIATFLQRVGRAGHSLRETPKGRLLPLTIDELFTGAALLRAVRRGVLDRTPQPAAPLDILAQQIVAAAVPESWQEEELFHLARRAWPYRELARELFESLLALHAAGRAALLHRDGVQGRVRGTRRARLTALTSGGAIPDRADYQVLLEPEGTFIGTIDEDFAIESSGGDIFQLGSTSWQILRVGSGTVHVADAGGTPPTLPFWFGEAPSRTTELTEELGEVRELGHDQAWLERETGIPPEAARQIAEHVRAGREALGAVPTPRRVVVERFFDESGGQQLVVHAPFGSRVNRAWGLALRKRFCRSFGFELQAAADEDAFLLSLGLQHSFALEEIFTYLRADRLAAVLAQAVLPLPLFQTRWRWNVQRALLVPRMQGGRKVPPPIQRMRADDLLARSFPQVLACGENLPAGDLPIPDALSQPMVAQTLEDCLHEAMDVDGAAAVLRAIAAGEIETVCVDTPAPSVFAHHILNAAPYAFLDDAPLEERRARAVQTRRALSPRDADDIGALDPEAVQRVREEAWPDPRDAEELHEGLLWLGYVTDAEAELGEAAPRRGRPVQLAEGCDSPPVSWHPWLAELAAAGRVARESHTGRWFATEATRDPREVVRGRLDALGPVDPEKGWADALPQLRALEGEGAVLRVRLDGREQWCERRLLARIQRYTLESLRRRIRAVSTADFLRFLADWQHLTPSHRLEGPGGVGQVAAQLAGCEIPAPAWERSVLPARIDDYRREWLDQLTLTGELVWGRLWGSAASAPKSMPIAILPRGELDGWLALAPPPAEEGLPWHARQILEHLRARGATFGDELQRACELLPGHRDEGLACLAAHGLITNDAFGALRRLLIPSARRSRRPMRGPRAPGEGRWSCFRAAAVDDSDCASPDLEAGACRLLHRYGVVFRKLLDKERVPIPWRDLLRIYRRLELRGDIRGGRFVGGRFTGEQFALPEAVELLRCERDAETPLPELDPRDPCALARAALVPVPPAAR